MDHLYDDVDSVQTISITQEEINEFKGVVLDWLELDDKIKQLDTQARKLKKNYARLIKVRRKLLPVRIAVK